MNKANGFNIQFFIFSKYLISKYKDILLLCVVNSLFLLKYITQK